MVAFYSLVLALALPPREAIVATLPWWRMGVNARQRVAVQAAIPEPSWCLRACQASARRGMTERRFCGGIRACKEELGVGICITS